VAAAIADNPIAAFVGQIQGFVTQIVQAVTQVIQTITQAVTALINAFIPAPIPTPVPVNAAPIVGSPKVGNPDPASGVVTGQINATDPDGDTLTYSGPTSTAKGAIVVDASTGGFTYTPTATARNNAANVSATTADKTDTFNVTVIDGKGGSATVLVGVVVSPASQNDPGPEPANRAPVAGTPIVGTPNASIGVVTGLVTATDPDGDTLIYSSPVSTAKGAVAVNANTGAFTYTPTATARHAAAQNGALAASTTDSFAVTASDGKGAMATIPVTVIISPANANPIAGTASVTTPDAATGVVTGTVSASDADGDTLTFSAPTSTTKGSVTINASTGAFTYAPTATARSTASASGATAADKADTFTVTVTDGYGGSVAVPVNVVVSPKESLGVTVAFSGYATGVVEGNSGITTTFQKVRLSGPASGTVTVTYQVTGYTSTPGVDFVAETGTLTFAPGQLEASLPIKIYGDTEYESDENVWANLIDVTGAVFDKNGSTSRAVSIINDDPAPAVTVAFSGYATGVVEGNSGITTTFQKVRLSGPASGTVTVTYQVTGYTSTPGVDFVAETGTLTFAPGQLEASLPIKIYGDTEYESDENVWANLIDVTGAVFDKNGSTSRAVSIINDDPAPAGARGGVPAAALDVSSAVVTKNQPTVISETVLSTPTVSTGALIAYAARADAPSIGEILQDTLFHKSAAVNLRQSTSAGLITGGLNGSTADGSNITYTVVQAPTRGSVVLAQDGSFTYTPNASLAAAGGTDTFIVTVDNGNPAYRLSGIGGAIQGIFSTLAQLIGLRQPDAITVEVPVSVIGSLQHNTVIATIAIPGSYGSPRGIAVTPDGSRVYVANDLDYIVPLFNNRVHRYAVAMISTSNNSVSAPIPAGSTPFQVAIAPDGSRVYVANFDGTVSAINTATNSVKTIRTVPGGLSGMAITPDGKSIYLTGDGGLSVINTATGALSANIFLGTSPASVAINPAGTRAYVASGSTGDSEQVQVIDTATQNISATVPIHGDAGWAIGWNPAAAIAVSPDGTRVYVTSLFRVAIDTFNHDSVSVIDTATNTVIGDPITVDFEPVALVVSSDGKRVYVGNGNGTVSVIDTTRNAVTATIPVGSFSIAGLALSPDGSRLYVTDQMGGKVAVIAT